MITTNYDKSFRKVISNGIAWIDKATLALESSITPEVVEKTKESCKKVLEVSRQYVKITRKTSIK